MNTASDLLQGGIEAIKQQNYSRAIQSLEVVCTQLPPNSKATYQAQIYLVRAYQENGQPERAIALCHQLMASNQPQVKAWAEKTLPRLSAPQTPASPPPPAVSPEQLDTYLKQGNNALKRGKFADAVSSLTAYCQSGDPVTSNYAQAQMWLVKAYKGNHQMEESIALCQQLYMSEREYVRIWASQFLNTHAPDAIPQVEPEPEPLPQPVKLTPGGTLRPHPASSQSSNPGTQFTKAGRALQMGVKLPMQAIAANLSIASGTTLLLLSGMVLALCLSLILISGSQNPAMGLLIATVITVVFNGATFFLAPFIMDLIQQGFYRTRWADLSEVDRLSPEAGRVIRSVCQQHRLSVPRLGIIEDNNPTAFTYGSLPNSARLIVSRGLFQYLDDDEVATVYAHELGHIVHWDFAVMTLAATLVQLSYLIYIYIREVANKLGNSDAVKQIKTGAFATSIMAFAFYMIGEYLLLYLSRTREYYADHFAAEVTGNPNGLSRALVKIAYGVMEESNQQNQPSKVLQGTRALGIADPRSASLSGTAYRVATEPGQIGRVFLWDMVNPWAWWMELNSTHPLTGKRVRALSTYAEHLGLPTEFDMAAVIREGRSLNKQRLYSNFARDLMVLWANWLGFALGLLVGVGLVATHSDSWRVAISLVLIGFGVGTLVKLVFMYPDYKRAPEMDVLTLMSDPYASPLRGRAIKLSGVLIGRGEAGYRFGCDWKLQDPTGMMYVRYASRFGPLGNFLFGMSQADRFIHQSVAVTGWFRRGVMPWVDLVKMDCDSKWPVKSYPRFWSLILGVGSMAIGFALPALI